MITQERFNGLFDYNPLTGEVSNRIDRSWNAKAGDRAGTVSGNGYRQIYLAGTIYLEHRLIWFMLNGEWPKELDHINGDRADNRIANLREATRSENFYNAEREEGTSGLRGVSLNKSATRWRARVWVDGIETSLGEYDTKEEAYAARLAASNVHYGEFAFHNRPLIRRI